MHVLCLWISYSLKDLKHHVAYILHNQNIPKLNDNKINMISLTSPHYSKPLKNGNIAGQ